MSYKEVQVSSEYVKEILRDFLAKVETMEESAKNKVDALRAQIEKEYTIAQKIYLECCIHPTGGYFVRNEDYYYYETPAAMLSYCLMDLIDPVDIHVQKVNTILQGALIAPQLTMTPAQVKQLDGYKNGNVLKKLEDWLNKESPESFFPFWMLKEPSKLVAPEEQQRFNQLVCSEVAEKKEEKKVLQIFGVLCW